MITKLERTIFWGLSVDAGTLITIYGHVTRDSDDASIESRVQSQKRTYGVVFSFSSVVKLHIREFRLDDYESVVELWREAGLVVRPGDEREGIELKLQRDPELFLVAEDDREILGVVLGAWDGRRGWINHLAVRQGHRRSGIGKVLIEELERRLIDKGALKVNAQIYQSNKSSLAFFKALNYEVHSDLIMVGRGLKQ